MIKLKIEHSLFQKQLEEKIIEGKKILAKKISDPKIIEQKTAEWEKDAINFLENNITNIPEQLISDIRYVREESHLSFHLKSPLFRKNPSEYAKYLSIHLERKIAAFKITADYLSVSEIIAGNKRPELETIQEKILFVLQKLYELYNDNFYSISLIFQINEIEYRDSEPNEIAENLKKRGYGIREADYSSKDLLKISVKGAAYIERKNKTLKNKLKKKQESEVNEKIDLVLSQLEKLGFGQEIIFNEIEELRGLSKKLNKKTWSQVIKGKVVDLALSELISKDVATFIYESLVDDKFKLLK